jgi:hypothetical protein
MICQLVCSDPEAEEEKLQNLFKSLVEAKRECGEKAGNAPVSQFQEIPGRKDLQAKRPVQVRVGLLCHFCGSRKGEADGKGQNLTASF